MPLEELIGEFAGTRYPGSPSNPWIVGQLRDGTMVTGETSGVPIRPGTVLRFFGKWKETKYGRQFAFDHYIEDEPLSRASIVAFFLRYLKGCGIGVQRSHTLYDLYGADCLRKLRDEPTEVGKAIGLRDDDVIRASEILNEHKRSIHSKVELVGLFEGKGFPKKAVEDCIEKWGNRASGIVRGDPFKLLTARISGAGFSRCDSLFLSLGHNPAKMKRCVLACWNELAKNSDGDTWIPVVRASEAIRRSIGGFDVKTSKVIQVGVRAKWLAMRKSDPPMVSVGEWARAEKRVANFVAAAQIGPTQWPIVDSEMLSQHQEEQARLALKSRVGCLRGGPGTGKTYTTAWIVKSILKQHSMGDIVVLAPTGKAAVRASEAMQAAGINLKARTIHRFLSPMRNGHGDGEWGFMFNSGNKIVQKFVVVDESSMVDVCLMAALMDACSPDTHILFVGDEGQLPPVGNGAPFRDIVANGVSIGSLEEVRRNAGMIVHGCIAIKNDQRIQMAKNTKEGNLQIVHAPTPSRAMIAIQKIYDSVRASGKRSIKEDVQVVVPLNSQGSLSREALNSFIQNMLTPPTGAELGKYRLGDKVICLKNGFYVGEDGEEYVSNGEMGIVYGLEGKLVHMEIPSFGAPARRVTVAYGSDEEKQFTLGYAITVHKSQGSQWPVVVVVADPAASRLAGKEWWYTAISRASDRCLIVGEQQTVETQAMKASMSRRTTFLKELIRGVF